MATCKSGKFVGKEVIMEFAIGCPDTLPLEAEWQRLGAMRTKEMNIEWETADATADDSIGSLRENLATFQTMTVSGDGTLLKGDEGAAAALIDLNKHVVNPTATGGQPYVWLRQTYPDLTFTVAALMTTFSRSAPYDDVATYSLEASAAPSPFGLIVEDTPIPVDPTGVTVAPTTASVAEGATTTLAATVAPVGASQDVTWTSAAPGTATVSTAGVVTGVAAGTVVITARSVDDPSKAGTATITVTTP